MTTRPKPKHKHLDDRRAEIEAFVRSHEGITCAALAEHLGVARHTLRQWNDERRVIVFGPRYNRAHVQRVTPLLLAELRETPDVSFRDLAAKYNVSASYISKKMRALGSRPRKTLLTPQDIARAHSLALQGVSYARIAQILGRSPDGVSRHLRGVLPKMRADRAKLARDVIAIATAESIPYSIACTRVGLSVEWFYNHRRRMKREARRDDGSIQPAMEGPDDICAAGEREDPGRLAEPYEDEGPIPGARVRRHG